MTPLAPPPGSKAVFHPTEDGFTIDLPPLGLSAGWQDGLLAAAQLVVLSLFCALAGPRIVAAPGWPERLFWLAGLVLFALILRPVVLWLVRGLLARALGRGTLIVADGRLYLHWRGVLAEREQVWDQGTITALDVEASALWILSEGRLGDFFHGRDEAELAWLAELLRSTLGIPADPPPLEGEVLVAYRMTNWAESRRGFLRVIPGQMRLRPRFVLGEGLVLRLHGAPRDSWQSAVKDSLGAGSLTMGSDDLSWGIGPMGVLTVRVHIPEPEDVDGARLEFTALDGADLRRVLDPFLQVAPSADALS